jgi:cytochrome P450
MSKLRQAASFAAGLYFQRAAIAYYGYVRRDTILLLNLRPGRVNPYPVYEKLRAQGTLMPTRLGNWATTSHRVCDAVLHDRRFGVRPEAQVAPARSEDFDLSFLERDPPDHTRLRKLAAPAFTPKAVAGYSDLITRTVGDLLDRAGSAGSFDLISGFAAALPIAVITGMLGIPDATSEDIARHGMTIGSALDGIKSLRHARELMVANTRLRAMFTELGEARRREPRDDLVSQLVAADQLPPDELLPLCSLLLVAGFETTVNLIGNAVLALQANPDEWKALCADPETMAPRAVEETLRFDPPVQRTVRIAREPLELEGRPIQANQLVVTLIGAANRDPEVYDAPGAFSLHRENPAPHLAFSGGIHYCLGAPLARLEATIALRVLAERMPDLTRTGPVRLRAGATIRGPLHLPVAAWTC